MFDVLSSILWLIVALGVLVTFHEYGHYYVARRCGVHVLRFSVGFGKPLWMRRAANGTEFAVAAIPLGGYVKMLDKREGPVAAEKQDEEFSGKPVGQRIAIVAAGPAFNLVFAIFAFWLMYMVGINDSRPVLGETSGLAAEAGLTTGDEIVAVNGEETASWTHAVMAMITPALDREPTNLTLRRPNGVTRQATMPFDRLGDNFKEERLLSETGLTPWRPELPPVVGEVSDGAAKDAGMAVGDRIVEVGGRPISRFRDISVPIQENAGSGDIEVLVDRDGERLRLFMTPQLGDDDRWLIGIRPAAASEELQQEAQRVFTITRFGPWEALMASFRETGRITSLTFGMLGRMITGTASFTNLSGPVSIANFARDSARLGFSRFLQFLAILSLSLAILNILPIPVLDGGHLLYYLIELVKGSPVSEQTQIVGQYFGLAVLFGLMILALYSDLLRLVP